MSNENRTFGIALNIYYKDNSSPETHYQEFNANIDKEQTVSLSVYPENENEEIDYVAFAFVYGCNENTMTVYNASLNILDTGYSAESTTDSSEGTTDDESSGTSEAEEDNYIDYEVVSETLDDSQPYMETSTAYDNTSNYAVSETDEAGNTVTYTYDVNGNVTSKTDGEEKIVNYTYDASGNVKSVSGEPTLRELNPFRYRGYVYDSESGLYYLQSRYYDPFTGRFINADVYCDTQSGSPLSTNMFAYCENNAVKRIDASGEKSTISAWHFKYDRNKAVNYAKKWWNSRNKQYYSYSSDCTNFVSQCFYAGGIPMTLGSASNSWHSFRYNKKGFNPFGWFDNNKKYNWDVSAPWRLCNDNYKYFKKSVYAKKTFTIYDTQKSVQSSVDKLKVGDPLYMDDNCDGKPNHAVIITEINRTKKIIYYAAHTDSHKWKILKSILLTNPTVKRKYMQ